MGRRPGGERPSGSLQKRVPECLHGLCCLGQVVREGATMSRPRGEYRRQRDSRCKGPGAGTSQTCFCQNRGEAVQRVFEGAEPMSRAGV